MQRIAVIDYGMGNLRSVSKAIEHVTENMEVVVSADASVIESADRVVCPGQGAAADCMAALQQSGLAQTITRIAGTRPFLGICMGYQVLLSASDENNGIECLNVVPGKVVRFDDPLLDDGVRLKVPHMGWSQVRQVRKHPMWAGIDDNSRFYFAHSYYCVPDDESVVTGSCHYGHDIAVSVAAPNLFACQFHPEKSAADGLQLLRNFAYWDGLS
ncbi:imidazole glycerol phosphate synthase subunit HisH [Granulosicoccus antarcticus]|uniref:Imidazole glycerol phosphate synthase subunit HisH n=1 Tax=Granulosicoccus antarcticus IMCC3135 TaxID=1192854 RepID=A0A2Z2P710_9GAMM|nr:imidazole glycerol phosphate synthase subunit HisH [Granulosicoccus antarcticus]ASJ76477.1 Imidazole glycerol phosphate synthase subunit HisH 1 [Granulosicoccus antarcticus IMCC3135]